MTTVLQLERMRRAAHREHAPVVLMSGFDRLLREINLYLAAVDAFRSEGCSVRWYA